MTWHVRYDEDRVTDHAYSLVSNWSFMQKAFTTIERVGADVASILGGKGDGGRFRDRGAHPVSQSKCTVDLKSIDSILKETVAAVRQSREQMYEVAELARNECLMLEREFLQAQEEVHQEIVRVEELEKADRRARDQLVSVSRQYRKRTHAEIQAAYEGARQVHAQLEVARERERHLRKRRDELARRLKNMRAMAERAEGLVSRVGVVMEYLSGDLEHLSGRISEYHRQQEVGFSIIRAQEEERLRVAREIHDGPAQTLAGVVLKLDVCQRLLQRDPERLAPELRAISEAARLSLQDVRKTIFNLRPMALDELGLAAALRSYVSSYREHTGVEVALSVVGQDERLPLPVEIALFRLVQESLSNVAKHAGTDRATVALVFEPNGITVTVRDHGRGFHVDPVWQGEQGNAFGIIGMRERVQMLRGTLNITSAPGQGTLVTCVLPLEAGEGESNGSKSVDR